VLRRERQQAIVSYVAKRGFASVAELGRMFSVSEMTIRRDLSQLAREGLLRRFYGGASATDSTFFEISFRAKLSQFAEEKERIGRAAAHLVHESETVLMDSGSTTLQVARALKDKRITVVSRCVSAATELSTGLSVRVLLPGGMLRKESLSLIGPETEAYFRDLRVDKLFLGVEGVDVQGGVTVPDPVEASAKRAMVKAAQQTIVVADHSKLGRNVLCTIIPLGAVDVLVTDSGAEPDILERLREHVRVLVV
jgi:DeoR/GlpR family transcriptional regulator of sugar metabolism